MSSPTRKSNHTPSIPFNEEAEKTANFLPVIDQRSQNTTPRNSIQLAPTALQGTNISQSAHGVFKINQKVSGKRQNQHYEGGYINTQLRRSQQSQQQDLLEGSQQRSKEISGSREFILQNDSTILSNFGINRKSIQFIQNIDKNGQNLYNNNYGYQVNLERDIKLNHSYEVDINSSFRIKQNLYSSSINSSIVQMPNSCKHRSQSCKRKPDQLQLGSIDFSNNNQIYAFTPQSAPHGQVEGSLIQRKNLNQIKTLSHPHTNISEQYQSLSQQPQFKSEVQQSQTRVKESTTPHPFQNPFDPLKQETQIHFETDGCRQKFAVEQQFSSQHDIKRENHFPKGFFIQTPTSSKRRTIRLNQNIYQTPLEKKEQQISSFSNINEYQFTFGDEENEIQEQKDSFDFYNNIQSSKNSNMYQSQQISQANPYQTENNQQEKIQPYSQNEKQKDFLNQQITKNDVCRSIAAKGGISLSANQHRPDEIAVIEQVTFGLFPIKDHNIRNSSVQNQYQAIHTPLNESPVQQTTSAGVRRYSKPKSLLFKKMFEKMTSLIDDQKRTESTGIQCSTTTNNSPVNGSERVIPSSTTKQENIQTKIFRSRQSSPKNKQFKPPCIKKQAIPITALEQFKNVDEQVQQINNNKLSQSGENPYTNGYTFSTPNNLESKESQEMNENQIYLNFQKKAPPQSNNSQHGSTSDEGEKLPQSANIQKLNQVTKQRNKEERIQLNNQSNDKMNKWLLEHNQFKQSNIADYQKYVGISCVAVLNRKVQTNQDNQQPNDNEQTPQYSNQRDTFIDKTRQYNNIQSNKLQQQQIQNQNPISDLISKSIQIQPSSTSQIQQKKELAKKGKKSSKNTLQVNLKLNSASDLDIQNTQSTQISKTSPKSAKKKAIIRNQGSLLLSEQFILPDENESQKQNQNKQIQDQKIQLKRVKEYPQQQNNNNNNTLNQILKKIQPQELTELALVKKVSKEKKDSTIGNHYKNIGPWISEKDDEEDMMMEQIIQNQTAVKI